MIVSPYQLVAEALNCDPASLNADSGLNRHPDWDSMGHLNVMLALERLYGIEINDQSIVRFGAMAAIVAHHAGMTGNGG